MDRQSHNLKRKKKNRHLPEQLTGPLFWSLQTMSFVKVLSKNELNPGTMKSVSANGKSILIVNLADKYYAIGNICTHMGCKLSSGSLKGEIIQCACHGSRFDPKTGKVVGGPAAKPEPTYEVKVEGDQIEIKA